MTEANVRQVMTLVSGKVPEEKMLVLKSKLTNASDDKIDEIMCLKLHNPVSVLLFSLFLGGFGIDRFIIGDTGLGVAKLLVGGLTLGIWPFIDIDHNKLHFFRNGDIATLILFGQRQIIHGFG